MKNLAAQHPMQLVLGSVIVGEEMATRGRQTTFASLCHDAAQWAVEVRDLLKEIACDAEFGAERLDALMVDGVMSQADQAEIRGYFLEIQREALTGEIE